jgi:YD repeat-containing protein
VNFQRDENLREDLHNGHKLNKVQLYDLNDELVKEFEFVTSYFVSDPEIAGSKNFSYEGDAHLFAAAGKRLRLDELIEKNGETFKVHSFAYNQTLLPYKTSYSQDYWGYFNGSGANSFLPAFEGPVNNGYDLRWLSIPGADREPNANYMKACLLEKITYPTGGETTFEFEPHEYYSINEQRKENKNYSVSHRVVNGETLYDGDTTFTYTGSGLSPYTIKIWGGVNCTNCEGISDEIYAELIGPTGFKQYLHLNAQCTGEGETKSCNNSFELSYPEVNLTTGAEYTLKVVIPEENQQFVVAHINVSWEEFSFYHDPAKLAGGLRLKKMIHHDKIDPSRNIVNEYVYRHHTNGPESVERSDGVLMAEPKFVQHYMRNWGGGIIIRSSPRIPLGSTQGSAVGYAKVSVLNGSEGKNGKTVYKYHCEKDNIIDYPERLPGVPTITHDLNGKLDVQEEYRNEKEDFLLVKSVKNEYEIKHKGFIKGIAVESSEVHFGLAHGNFHYYPIFYKWVQLVKTTEKVFDPYNRNKFLTTSTEFGYNSDNLQVNREKTIMSDGSTIIRHYTYPIDYHAVNNDFALSRMNDDDIFMHNAVIESFTTKYEKGQTGADAKFISGKYTDYEFVGDKVLPVSIGQMELSEPIAGFTPMAPYLPSETRYRKNILMKYDPETANLIEVKKVNDGATVYVWGYNHQQPIAAIQNSSEEEVSHALNSPSIITFVDAEGKPLGDVEMNEQLNALRSRLPDAMVTTYTYHPLKGMTSRTDPNGIVTFFVYDDLGRLSFVKDHEGNLLQKYDYNYQVR